MTYRWSNPDDRARRDGHILELWAMGEPRDAIADRFDITPQRVSQIVNRVGTARARTRRHRKEVIAEANSS